MFQCKAASIEIYLYYVIMSLVYFLFQSGIQHVYNQFRDVAQQYQEFWDMMEEIDRNTWILEPEKPTHSATYRRIAISRPFWIFVTAVAICPRISDFYIPEHGSFGKEIVEKKNK